MWDRQGARESSLRWGGLIGGVGAALGVVSYLAGALLAPVNTTRLSGDAAITSVFVHVLLVLVALGVVLGLAYYAGIRVAREQIDTAGATGAETPAPDRAPAALGGAVAMLIYWFVTTLYVYLFPPFGQRDSSLQALEGHALIGVVFVIMGAGLGSMGARAAAARRLITRVIIAPSQQPAALVATAVSGGAVPTTPVPEDPDKSTSQPEQI